jgi:hypothetical protein
MVPLLFKEEYLLENVILKLECQTYAILQMELPENFIDFFFSLKKNSSL